jgi:protein TonB
MNQEITNIRLQFACNKNWDNMTDADMGKYCHDCKKIVYDFTDAKQNEFLAIMAQNNNNVCGKFRMDQLTQQPTLMPVWKKWLSAAMILIGINIFNNKAQAQKVDTAITIDERILSDTKSSDTNRVFGIVNYEPQFPGGLAALLKFLKDNIQYKKGIIDGRVLITLIIKKDGSLTDIKAVRGVSPANNEEAIRVFKLSPKWIPDTSSGNPRDVSYIIPVMFKRQD